MSKNKEVAYSDLSDTADDDFDEDGVGLVLKDDENEGNHSRTRKYRVSEGGGSSFHASCQPQRLSRNERICLVVGLIVLAVIIVTFVTVAVVARPSSSSKSTGGGGGGGSGTGDGGVVMANTQWEDVRLPLSVVPETYDLSLTLDMESFQVTGSVSIVCSVRETADFIVLHAKDMQVDAHRVVRDNKEMEHKEVIVDDNDFFVFNFTSPLDPGHVNLILNFSYTLREDLAGFYRSSYTDKNGTVQYLGTTQFESTDARRAFPCFDEPSFKANFTIHMTHQSRYRAWSNMPPLLRTEEDANGFVTTHFQTSVRMSTYLVAFIVSNFECVNDTVTSSSGNPLLIQVCSNPAIIGHTHYALEAAKDIILFYERKFGISYPLPKQDLFAIPDFDAGAMENWGLITYRETALLYDAAVDPATSKQRVAVVIAHELAHQWFGDLVTMAWWDGLWLNEGFASFVEYIGTNHIEPSFNMMEQFVADDFSVALTLDSLKESHPILQEVMNPDEISSLFDAISYQKGASVIRMLKSYIGTEAFWTGITSYLKKHEYGNAETHELWEALQAEAPPGASASVPDIMDTWTKQMGFPVFNVNQTEGTLTQTRFLYVQPDEDQDSMATSPYNYIWKAPFNYIHYSTEATVTNLSLVTTSSMSVEWPTDGWIKANIDQTGFYRVNYEVSNWLRIIEYLKRNSTASVLSAEDRAGLLDDAFALSLAGQLDTRIALNLSSYLIKETEYIPWGVALSWLSQISGLLSLTPDYGQFKNFMNLLLRPAVERLPTTSSNLTHLDIYLRSSVLHAAAHYGNTEVIENATDLFQGWKEEDASLDPDLKSLVYGIGVEYGGEEEWDFVWQKYVNSSDPYEKRLFLSALARSREPWILNRYLNYSVTKLRAQDTLSVVVYISRNIYGRHLAWNFLRSNWNFFRNRYGGGSYLGRVVLYITASFATDFELQEMMNFFEANPDAGTAMRPIRQAIEIVRRNTAWLKTSRYNLFSTT